MHATISKFIEFYTYFFFFHNGLFVLTLCKKISQIRFYPRKTPQMSIQEPKVGNIFMLRKLNFSDLFNKPKNTEFANFLFPFWKYHMSCKLFFINLPIKWKLHLQHTLWMAFYWNLIPSICTKNLKSSKHKN